MNSRRRFYLDSIRFNTSTLGYKLLSGNFKKHSEQLNKFLSGLFDADGCIRVNFDKRGYTSLEWKLAQSSITDTDFEMLRGLFNFYKKGNLYYYIPSDEKKSPVCEWRASNTDAIYMCSHLKKHSRIKATHMDNMEWLYLELKGKKLLENQIEELKEYSECSRKNSSWFKYPKHPSWSWLTGILAGDGSFIFKQKIRQFRNGMYPSNDLNVKLTGHEDDIICYEFIKKALGGNVSRYKGNKGVYWRKSLGRGSEKFALPFLYKMRQYMCLKKKYNTIQRMIDFHESNRQQRLKYKDLNKVSDSPN